LDLLKPEYNILPVAGSSLGLKHSAETKAKMSAARIGCIVSAETKAKLSATKKGNQYAKGLQHSAETIAKLSAARKGRLLSADTKAKTKKIFFFVLCCEKRSATIRRSRSP
jgi:hypothetical protein